MGNSELIPVALRVLNAHMARTAPAREDVERLRGVVGHDLPADVLAARVVEREVERVRARRAGSGEAALRKSSGA